jgi:hypothetical protein
MASDPVFPADPAAEPAAAPAPVPEPTTTTTTTPAPTPAPPEPAPEGSPIAASSLPATDASGAPTPTPETVVATWQHATIAGRRYEEARAAFLAAAREFVGWFDRFVAHRDAVDPTQLPPLADLPTPKPVTAKDLRPPGAPWAPPTEADV